MITVRESCNKEHCRECDTYNYVFEIRTSDNMDDDYCNLALCKKCLLQLLKEETNNEKNTNII